MSHLQELQESFFKGVLRGELQNATLLRCDARLDAHHRMCIYADAYTVRLTSALVEDFPMTAKLLGRAFDGLARDYIHERVSRHYTLQGLGQDLPLFIATRAERPDAAELARMESLRVEVYVEKDDVSQEMAALVAYADAMADVHLNFVACVRHATMHYDVTGLARALADDAVVPEPSLCTSELVVWRRDLDVWHTALVGPAAEALRLAFQGATVGDLCACFADCEDPVTAAFAALGAWFADGWIHSVGERNAER